MAIVMHEAEIEGRLVELLRDMVHPQARLIGRQVTFPSGRRVDLLAYHRSDPVDGAWKEFFTVIEVKANKATFPDILQLIRYTEELGHSRLMGQVVQGLLVAPGFADGVEAVVGRMDRFATARVRVQLEALPSGFGPDGWSGAVADSDPERLHYAVQGLVAKVHP